jgi:hypothetical protein
MGRLSQNCTGLYISVETALARDSLAYHIWQGYGREVGVRFVFTALNEILRTTSRNIRLFDGVKLEPLGL